jgi:hypothetical protein
MSESTPETPAPAPADPTTEPAPSPTETQDPDFERRLAAGTGEGTWYLTEEDQKADELAKAAETGDPQADFERRLAAGTGGTDFHLTEEDKQADAAAKAADPSQETTDAVGTTTSTGEPGVAPTPDAQAVSQPGAQPQDLGNEPGSPAEQSQPAEEANPNPV